MTVQRAMEVLRSQGLEPINYSFICHDSWERETKFHLEEYEQIAMVEAKTGETSYEQGGLKSEAWTEGSSSRVIVIHSAPTDSWPSLLPGLERGSPH